MRGVTAGNADGGTGGVDRGARRRRGAHPLGAVRQSVPLHRLYPDRRCRARGPRRIPQGRQGMTLVNRYIGAPIERVEDLRFLRGRGEYVADLMCEGMLHAAILRSPVARGRIRALDTSPARAIRGVHAVITAAEIGAVPRIPLRLQTSPATEPFRPP